MLLDLDYLEFPFAINSQKQQHSFVVIDNGKQSASRVGSGLFNPIALKRTKPAWMGHQLMSTSDTDLYKALEHGAWEFALFINALDFENFTCIQKVDINDWHQASVHRRLQTLHESKHYSKIETLAILCSIWFWRGGRIQVGLDTALLVDRYFTTYLEKQGKTLIARQLLKQMTYKLHDNWSSL